MYAKWNDQDKRFGFSPVDNGGVEISEEYHAGLLNQESLGKQLVPDDQGRPVAVERASQERNLLLGQIIGLEAQITPRRLREALLTSEGRAWLAAKEAEIQLIRSKL